MPARRVNTGEGGGNPVDRNRPVRLLIIDKTAVLEHVRQRWDRLAATPDIDLTLLTPSHWIENYRRYDFVTDPAHRYRAIIGRGAFPGRELIGFYRSGLRRAFELSRPDVVLMMEESFSMFGLQVARARRRWSPDAPLIFYNNNIVSYDLPGFRLSRLYRWIARKVTPQADLGLCVNSRALDVLVETGFPTPGVELFYGVDDRSFFPARDESERQELRRGLGIPAEAVAILCIGRLLEGKGYQDVVEAVARVQQHNRLIPIHLMIVGSGPYREELAQRASDRLTTGTYSFVPAVSFDQVPTLMRSVDLHILPSHPELNEQFGRVNVEAMLCGILAVASRTGGMPDVVGEGGILFESGNVDELAAIIADVSLHPDRFEEVRRRGRERALERFSVEGFLDGLREITVRLFRGDPPAQVAAEFRRGER